MRHLLKKLLPPVAVALTVKSFSLPVPAGAQTYPIDCAIDHAPICPITEQIPSVYTSRYADQPGL